MPRQIVVIIAAMFATGLLAAPPWLSRTWSWLLLASSH
jgi:hypothetical protein